MPASIIAPIIINALSITSAWAVAAVTFGVRLLTTAVVSNVIAKRAMSDINKGASGTGTQQIGNRIQLQPATDNKIPVVYGSAFMKPIITDAKISTDQKTMWYVLTFSEAMESDEIGTLSFGDIYWGDKRLTFDTSDRTKVVSWTNSDGTVENQPNGLVNIYLYRDGSDRPVNTSSKAYEVLATSEIAEANRWNSSKKMSKLAFAIVKIKYDQEKGITSLPEITAVINNTLVKPGSVIKDYLTNTRYGAGLPLTNINTARLTALDAYSDETISYTPSGGGETQTSPRFRVNGPVDTTKSLLDNLVDLCETCDSWLQWNEQTAQWSVVLNRSVFDDDPDGSDIRQINSSNIVGGIDVSPIDLNSTFNSVETQFPNSKIKDQPGYYTIDIAAFPNVQRSPNEPDNRLTIALPYVNNVVQAQYIAARRLLQSREDLVINFTMDYSGIQIDAGDVIGIHHEQYGWGDFSETVSMPYGKLFRVNQVQEGMSEDGSLFARITASEYNDGVYDDSNIDLADFEPELNTGITDPTIVTAPGTPTLSNIDDSAVVPSFEVNTVIAGTGSVVAIEYWFGTAESISNNTYKLWTTEYPAQGTFFDNGSTVTTKVTGLDAGVYYWRVRAVGTRRKSEFTSSVNIIWEPEVVSAVIGQNFYVSFMPSNLSVARTGTNKTVNLSGIQPRAWGLLGGQSIPYVEATNDEDAAFMPNSWRIANSSTTNHTSAGIYTVTNLTFTTGAVSTSDDGSMVITNIDQMTATPAYITIPVRYKDGAGNIFQGFPATQQLVFVDNGLTFYQPKVWFLAPINANTATVAGGIYDRTNRVWVERPVTRYGVVGGSLTTTTNYDNPIDVISGYYRWSAVADDGASPLTEGTFTAVWNQSPTIEAGFGPTPAFIDFDYAGGTAFYKSTTGTISPSTITIRVNAQGINTPIANWTVSGANYTTSATIFTRDTITLTPISTASIIQATVSVGAYTKSVNLSIVEQGDPASRGFIPLAYIPISINPNLAAQSQLTAAWTAYTGLTPQNRDAATFYFGEIRKSFIYENETWTAAAQSIDGALIVNGTIRTNSLSANEIFTNNFASTNATFNNFTSAGYWLDGTTGNARFGGNVSIGNLIEDGVLKENVVAYDNLAPGLVNKPLEDYYVPSAPVVLSSSANYDWDYLAGTSFYGWHKTICYATDYLDADTALVNANFSCNFEGSGFLKYPNCPIIVLWLNTNSNGGSGVRYYVPANGNPLPSGSNANGSIISYKIPTTTGTSYNGSVSLNFSRTLLSYGNPNSRFTIGVSLINGLPLQQPAGTIVLSSFNWSVNVQR